MPEISSHKDFIFYKDCQLEQFLDIEISMVIICNSQSENTLWVSIYLRFVLVLENYVQLLTCGDKRVDNIYRMHQGGTWVTGSSGNRVKTRPFSPGPGRVPGQDLGAGPGPGRVPGQWKSPGCHPDPQSRAFKWCKCKSNNWGEKM